LPYERDRKLELIFEKIIGWVVPFILGAVVGGVSMWFLVIKALCDGVQCLLRAEIIRQNEKWVKVGYCPIYAKQALTREYKAYSKLHGNDVATGLYHEVMELPERKKEHED
jgi:hypothetical protein